MWQHGEVASDANHVYRRGVRVIEHLMYCPECDVEHAEWTDKGTEVNYDGRTTLDLWECDRCGFVLEGVRL